MNIDKKTLRKLSLSKTRCLSGGLGPHRDPALSPDGRWVAWSAHVAGGAHIYICDRAGRLARQLSAGNGQHLTPTWSPDSASLAFALRRTDAGRWQLWQADLHSEDGPRCLLQSTRFHYQHPSFSVDGAGLFYSSDQGAQTDGAACLWRLDLSTTDKVQLTHTDLHRHRRPQPSPDGHRLLFLDRNPPHHLGALWLLDLTQDAAPAAAPGKPARAWRSATFLTPSLLLGLTSSKDQPQLRLLDLSTGDSASLREGQIAAISALITPEGRVDLVWAEDEQIFSAHIKGLHLGA